MAMKVETFCPSVGLHNAMPRCIGFGCKAVDKMGDYLNSFAQFVCSIRLDFGDNFDLFSQFV